MSNSQNNATVVDVCTKRLNALKSYVDGKAQINEAFRAQAAAHRSGPPLPRPTLLARLETARKDPRFAAPVAMLFQQKTAEACSDAELQALVDSIELLAKLGDA